MKEAKLTKSAVSKILNTNVILDAEENGVKSKIFIKFNSIDDRNEFSNVPTKESIQCEIKIALNGVIYKDKFDKIENLEDCIICHGKNEEESYVIYK